jgi:signal-induced proliferation-associated 1 like protein 1
MDYYNSNVLRARTNAGLSSARQQRSNPDPLYRSNSSLELTHHSDYHHHQQQPQHHHHRGGGGTGHFGGSTAYVDSRAAATDRPLISPLLKREYGSHGSIDVIASDRNSAGRASTGENFFAMLQDYRPAVLDMIDGNSEWWTTRALLLQFYSFFLFIRFYPRLFRYQSRIRLPRDGGRHSARRSLNGRYYW